MRNVLKSSSPHPLHDTTRSTLEAMGSSTDQTVCGSGRHCQQTRASAKLANSTKVLRSISSGTMRVQSRLNPGRAMMLC